MTVKTTRKSIPQDRKAIPCLYTTGTIGPLSHLVHWLRGSRVHEMYPKLLFILLDWTIRHNRKVRVDFLLPGNNSVNDVPSYAPFAGLGRMTVLELRVINYYLAHSG